MHAASYERVCMYMLTLLSSAWPAYMLNALPGI